MIFNAKKLFKNGFFAVAIYSLATYLIAHVAYMYMNETLGDVMEYVSLYVGKLSSFIIPASVSAVALTLYTYCGIKSAVLFSLAASSGRVFFTLPYYYIIFIYNYAYDSVEALALALVASVGIILLGTLGSMLLVGAAVVTVRLGLGKGSEISPRDHLADKMQFCEKLDILGGANPALAVCTLCILGYNLIAEIIDTVSFFIEYGLDFVMIEIITIIANYLILLALTAVSYIAMAHIKNILISKRLQET